MPAWVPRTGIIGVIAASGVMGKLVLLVLLLFSIAVWAVIIEKWKVLGRVERESQRFLGTFRQRVGIRELQHLAGQNRGVVLGRILEAGLNEARKLTGNQAPVNPQATEWIIAGAQKPPAEEGPGRLAPELMPNVLSAMERAVSSETQNLEQRLGVLATATSVCPFLGLFGTVWGIMDSFIEIQSFGTANINVVAPGIAEALITTVGGLAVAIPAVMAYNYFARRLRRIIGIMDDFASEFASELRRGMYR